MQLSAIVLDDIMRYLCLHIHLMIFNDLFRPIDGSIIQQAKSEENQGAAGIREGENELMTFLTHDVMS